MRQPRGRCWATGLGPVLVLIAATLLVGSAARAATELVSADKGPAGQPLFLWEAPPSFEGEEQYDARLDKPVHLWRTAMPLAEVFAELEGQTGVSFGFWPEGDENPRVRVNAYLNEKAPPTLRDVMVQLGWAVDCALAFAQGGTKEGGPTYYLLRAGVGREGLEGQGRQLEQVTREEVRAEARDVEEQIMKMSDYVQATMQGKLEELEQALAFSPEAAAARYRGEDDQLLLALLDPQRRAAAQLTCEFLSNSMALVRDMQWEELSEPQKALARKAFTVDEAHLKEYRLMVMGAGMELSIQASRAVVEEDHDTILGHPGPVTRVRSEPGSTTWYPLLYLHQERPMRAADILALARLLGENVPEDQEAAYVAQYVKSWEEDRLRKPAEAPDTSRQGVLSEEDKERLSSLSFAVGERRPQMLWEVQEEVARATGWQVISDCFWQGPRDLGEANTLLEALTLSCAAKPARLQAKERVERFRALPWAVAWEWGKAGSFLRFRSAARGLWRASLLSPQALAEVDQYLAPHVKRAAERRGEEDGVSWEFPGTLSELMRVAQGLSDLQLEYGGRLLYEDPTTEEGAWRHGVREAFFWLAGQNVDGFRLLVSLEEEQWRLVSETEKGMPCTALKGPQGPRLQRALRRGDGWTIAPRDHGRVWLVSDGAFPTRAHPEGRRSSRRDRLLGIFLPRIWDDGGPEPSSSRGWPFWELPNRSWVYPYPPDYLGRRAAGEAQGAKPGAR